MAGVVGFVLLPPFLMSVGQASAADLSYKILHATCHQLPERSLFIFGYKMGVCSRCFAIYGSMLAAGIAYPLFRRLGDESFPNKWWLILAILPILIDGGTQLLTDFGIAPGFLARHSTNELRVATGAIFGFTVSFYIIPILAGIQNSLRRQAMR